MLGCTETVTIINTCTDENGADAYQSYVISGASWCEEYTVSPAKAGDTPGSRFICRIPQDRCGGYLPPQQWKQLADKQGCWTVQPDSYVVRGALAALPEGFLPPASLDTLGVAFFRVQNWRDSRSAPRLGHIRIGGSR